DTSIVFHIDMESYCFHSAIASFLLLASSSASLSFSHPSSLLGVHPLDEKYYSSQSIKCKDGSKSFSRDRLNDNFCDCSDGTDEPGTSACPAGKFYCRNLGSKPQFIVSSHVNDRFCEPKRKQTKAFSDPNTIKPPDLLPTETNIGRHKPNTPDLPPPRAKKDNTESTNPDLHHHEPPATTAGKTDCCDGSDEYDGTIHCPNTCVMGGNAENMYGNYNSKVNDQGIFAEREAKDGVKSEESVHNVNDIGGGVPAELKPTLAFTRF
ncbi:hypothetical protein TSUD_135070, partial [Trifolium subterraneum]